MSKVLLEREGYRFVEKGIIELNGMPDYRRLYGWVKV